MPSVSLQTWQNDRMLNLAGIDGQCSNSLALRPSNPRLVDENLRGYVLLLSAHFQGYCRDLYAEATQVVVAKVRYSLQLRVQRQFTTGLKLDHGNPNLQNIRLDFERFGFVLNFAAVDPTNARRLNDLSELNDWRNVAAHHGKLTGPPLTIHRVRAWRNSCDGLATSLDRIMYNELRIMLRRPPWAP
jgi:hypothetical protein